MGTTFVLDKAVETSFTSGKVYRFAMTATNILGEGPRSNSVSIALADKAPTPLQVTRDLSRSTKTSVYIQWQSVAASDGLPIDGYLLYMTELGTGTESLVYNGSANSERLFYNVTGLTTAQRYSFAVRSVNFNGVSEPSPELTVIICIPPYGFPKPYFVSATRNNVTVGWKSPTDDGGCPLQTYRMYLDDKEIDATTLLNRPYIH